MRASQEYNLDELIEIGQLAVDYINAYQDQQAYRINNPVSSLVDLMAVVKPTNQAHSDLEMAVLSGGKQ
jgi:hypothetical protein